MEQEKLLQYMKDAITQETDIVQQENLIAEYNQLSLQRKPQLQTEVHPVETAFVPTGITASTVTFFVACILGIASFYPALSYLSNSDGSSFGLIVFFIGAILFFYSLVKSPLETRAAKKKHKADHQAACRAVDRRNAQREKDYQRDLADWESTNKEMLAFMNKPLAESRALLKRFYDSSDTIYAKYCTLPALTSIYEYFVTGRCTELTGPHGAYNMYEDEVRKDTVISQLNTVIENLEQIRANQYMLYQQVSAIRQNTEVIVGELQQIKGYTVAIAELTALNAYYAALTERNTRICAIYDL